MLAHYTLREAGGIDSLLSSLRDDGIAAVREDAIKCPLLLIEVEGNREAVREGGGVLLFMSLLRDETNAEVRNMSPHLRWTYR